MSNVVEFNGFTDAQAILNKMPYELREKYLKKALREAMREMTRQSSTIVAAMDVRPLNKTQRERPWLKAQIRDKQSSYESGAVIVSLTLVAAAILWSPPLELVHWIIARLMDLLEAMAGWGGAMW